MNSAADNHPVLVGVGVSSRREDDWRKALEPLDLMLEAVCAAGLDATGVDFADPLGQAMPQASISAAAASALRAVQWIAVPKGRWSYSNPGGEIARSIGADHAHTVLSSVGVLQQTLVGEACARIQRGEIESALVAGADAGFRLLRAQIGGESATERVCDGEPDEFWQPAEELRHPAEKRAGLRMPVGLYALIDSAWRAYSGAMLDEHRDSLAEMVSGFSRIATDNPDAWQRRVVAAADIREASDRNPMQAFPYTRLHCSSWNVDQGAALLFCSVWRARELGIPENRWVYPLVSSESNHMVPVTARAELHRCIGAEIAGRAALQATGLSVADLDLIELYSCFPIAVRLYADALGIGRDRAMTTTGGMHFAGGPYNNYQLQSIARTARLLRQGKGRTAMVTGVSGIVTKQGFGIWSVSASKAGFTSLDLTDRVAHESKVMPVVDSWDGAAKVVATTVLHSRGESRKGVVLLDTPGGQRVLATTTQPGITHHLEQNDLVGQSLSVRGTEVVL
jgi:acetyl-CoA C-acetyltransferase